jgi:hypothetical protein
VDVASQGRSEPLGQVLIDIYLRMDKTNVVGNLITSVNRLRGVF